MKSSIYIGTHPLRIYSISICLAFHLIIWLFVVTTAAFSLFRGRNKPNGSAKGEWRNCCGSLANICHAALFCWAKPTLNASLTQDECKQRKSILFVKCLSFVNVKRRSSIFCIHTYMRMFRLLDISLSICLQTIPGCKVSLRMFFQVFWPAFLLGQCQYNVERFWFLSWGISWSQKVCGVQCQQLPTSPSELWDIFFVGLFPVPHGNLTFKYLLASTCDILLIIPEVL